MEERNVFNTAAEECGHCGRSVWADEESELFLTSDQGFECPSAPLQENPAGSQYPKVMGVHQP